MTELTEKVGFAPPIAGRSFLRLRSARVALLATLALAISLVVAATAVSIGMAHAEAAAAAARCVIRI